MAHSKEYMRNYINKWRKKRREYAFNKLGGKCRECGSTDKLEFDHIDHNSKILNIARMWTASKIKFAKSSIYIILTHSNTLFIISILYLMKKGIWILVVLALLAMWVV